MEWPFGPDLGQLNACQAGHCRSPRRRFRTAFHRKSARARARFGKTVQASQRLLRIVAMGIWDLLAVLLMWAGHTEMCVTVLNRIHSLPLHRDQLKFLRRIHDTLLVAFPVIVVAVWGMSAPLRFLRGQWAALSPVSVAVFLLCLAGVAGLTWSTLRWWIFSRASTRMIASASVVDVACELGDLPIGPGHLHWLAYVPGNEQFFIEVNEKSLVPPNWPMDLDGFSILHLSDWHLCSTYSRRFFECAADSAARVRADLVAFTGDLFDDEYLLDWLPSTLGQLSAPLGKWFILGNHDSWQDPKRVRESLESLDWRHVPSEAVRLDTGIREVWLAGDETPWMGLRPQWRPDSGPRILFSHTPDHLSRAAAEGVDVMLAGHNHGGQVLLPLIGPVFTPSRYGCRYPSGVFQRGPCVMHVARGLAGRHPLRIGCRPEITRLVLRSPRVHHKSETATIAGTAMEANDFHRDSAAHVRHPRPFHE